MAISLFWWEAAAAKFPTTNYPAFVFTAGTNVSYTTLSFVGTGGSADEYCYFLGVVPDSYTAGGDVTVRIYWTAASGATAGDDCRFVVTMLGRVDDEAFDTATGDSANADDQVTAVGDWQVATSSHSSPALAPGDGITIKLLRDYNYANGGTDLAEDALVWGLQLVED